MVLLHIGGARGGRTIIRRSGTPPDENAGGVSISDSQRGRAGLGAMMNAVEARRGICCNRWFL